ncbi:MAG TPA: hypothetical protein VL854_05970 [Nitrososphaeraceae archaeon]|nr:hypothetical protein [Nitrososphaeraceae archaeon]
MYLINRIKILSLLLVVISTIVLYSQIVYGQDETADQQQDERLGYLEQNQTQIRDLLNALNENFTRQVNRTLG